MPKPALTSQYVLDAAAILNCSVAAIKAVAEVESNGDGFLSTGEPKILFGRYIFSSRNNRIFDRTNTGVSDAKPGEELRWAHFARKYNGPQYQKENYDTKLAAACEKFSTGEKSIPRTKRVKLIKRNFDAVFKRLKTRAAKDVPGCF